MFRFSSPKGPAVDILKQIRADPACKRAKIQTRGKGKNITRLIIGIGQVHPVLSGKFSYFQARRIGKVQAWIYHLCHFFSTKHGISTFGQEGFSLKKAEVGYARLSEATIKEAAKGLEDPDAFFTDIAQQWRRALRAGRGRKEASLLNALALLQADNEAVSIFPIEQRDVHGAVGKNIERLRVAMHDIENDPDYQNALAKQGQDLTHEEYDAVIQKGKLVKKFNAMLSHGQRDRSILQEVVRHSEKQPITVFILGNAHRKGMLKLANQHLSSDTLFVWITPPLLWWWKAMLYRTAWAIGLLAVIIGGVSLLLA